MSFQTTALSIQLSLQTWKKNNEKKTQHVAMLFFTHLESACQNVSLLNWVQLFWAIYD